MAPYEFTTAINAMQWSNTSSSSYWVSLQGSLLQDWSKSHTADSILPLGDLVTVVRVRDAFGATAVAGVLGPTVTAPVGGVEPAQAAAALTSAVTLNEAPMPSSSPPKSGKS